MTTCVFCGIVSRKILARIVYENDRAIAFLDKYPQSKGHLQLVPKEHFRYIYEAPDMGYYFDLAGTIIRKIVPVLGATHVTIATFGVEIAHAHIWIVPQYGRNRSLTEGASAKGTDIEKEDGVAEIIRRALSGIS